MRDLPLQRAPLRRALILPFVLFLAMLWLTPSSALAQRTRRGIDLGSDGDRLVDQPFTLTISTQGFDPQGSAPQVTPLQINGCQVELLSSDWEVNPPNMVVQINGFKVGPKFIQRYHVTCPSARRYVTNSLTAVQDGVTLEQPPAQFNVERVEELSEVQLQVNYPDRPVWLGEDFDVTVDLISPSDQRGRPQNAALSNPVLKLPLLELGEAFGVSFVSPQSRSVFDDGLKIQLSDGNTASIVPEQAVINNGGVHKLRTRVTLRLTPRKAGRYDLPAATATGQGIRAGQGRRQRSFKAIVRDTPRAFEIKPLPLADRPDSFSNAIGESFGVEVSANNTVVAVGDTIELEVTVRGKGDLEGLILPRLDGSEGLSKDLFSVPPDATSGELIDDDEAKRFIVKVRPKSNQISEIPPIPFSYFNPATGRYRTVRSNPIALSVKGAKVISAQDVVTATSPAATTPAAVVSPSTRLPPSGAKLSLSPAATALDGRATASALAPWIIALYSAPLFLFALLWWRAQTTTQRHTRGAERRTRSDAEAAIDAARSLPAREAAPQIVSSMRALARQLGISSSSTAAFFERIENRAFDPRAAEQPLDESLRVEALDLIKGWQRARPGKGSAALGLLLIGAALASFAPAASAATLDEARATYQRALGEENRTQRISAFSRATTQLEALARAHPTSPALLTDWGNAALGAREYGVAILAYRRALALEPDYEPATTNLSWVRQTLPEAFPIPRRDSALDTLLFWHQHLPAAMCLLFGAMAFAAAVILLAPWPTRPGIKRTMRVLAIFPTALWLWLSTAGLLSPDASSDAVVQREAVTLRAADNRGAGAVLSAPLPAGAEVTVLESRGDWTQIALADGKQGWLPSDAIARVIP